VTDSTLYAVMQPDTDALDLLHELLRKGARDLIAKAVEAKLNTLPLAVRRQETARWLPRRGRNGCLSECLAPTSGGRKPEPELDQLSGI